MLPDGTPFGFYNAPICKALLFITGTASTWRILFSSVKLQSLLPESNVLNHFLHSQIFTNIVRFLCYSSAKNLFFGTILLYKFRMFERRYGSTKFADFILRSTAIGAVFQYGVLLYTERFVIDDFPTGPFWMVFSLYVPFCLSVPFVSFSNFFGIFPISGKLFTYILGMQMLSTSKAAMLSGLTGIIAGAISYFNILYVESWLKFPSFLSNVFSKLFDYPPTSRTVDTLERPQGATLEIQRQIRMDEIDQRMLNLQQANLEMPSSFSELMNANRDPQQYQQPATEVSEEQIQRLIEMGFTRDAVFQALTLSNNNIAMAMNILLSQ
ncbi:ubiquitin-associated domain-containing protein 2-like [Xenia sp. Carnegie-2017]|uniref:ubiquitin-associated domain-containing protein 2-like n=1 Tax=Xenia sp. Carnegie-2017 TaxID=2897299 RepID=UPI001F042FCA|nr:ubiquitin-associated domain-containing protein 2-like [Xenia sp. Carnegie-2017]